MEGRRLRTDQSHFVYSAREDFQIATYCVLVACGCEIQAEVMSPDENSRCHCVAVVGAYQGSDDVVPAHRVAFARFEVF